MLKAFQYVQRFLDPTDAKASMRHLMFALVMCSGLVFLAADMVARLWRGGVGITSDWNMALGILAASATGGKVLGAKNANDPDPASVKE
jgi:hypothetical protein